MADSQGEGLHTVVQGSNTDFVFGHNEPQSGSLRQPRTNRQVLRTMSDERLIKKRRRAAIYDSVQGLSIQYAEVLRLRQAVQEAETQLATQSLAGSSAKEHDELAGMN